MGGLFGTPDYVRCCCGKGCTGCCFCRQSGFAIEADYEIDAPDCPLLDGQTGIVGIPDSEGLQTTNCGPCANLLNSVTYNAPTFSWDDAGIPGECVPQGGADLLFTFHLFCLIDREGDDPSLPECCRKIRLAIVQGGLNSPIDAPTTLWISPITCSCDPEGGLSALFSFEQIIADCDEGTYESGPCEGRTRCPQIDYFPFRGNCSLTGATILFTQSGCVS
jgi:hypothetical protein